MADPRAPEWLSYTEGHEQWWDTIWAEQKKRGQKATTLSEYKDRGQSHGHEDDKGMAREEDWELNKRAKATRVRQQGKRIWLQS